MLLTGSAAEPGGGGHAQGGRKRQSQANPLTGNEWKAMSCCSSGDMQPSGTTRSMRCPTSTSKTTEHRPTTQGDWLGLGPAAAMLGWLSGACGARAAGVRGLVLLLCVVSG